MEKKNKPLPLENEKNKPESFRFPPPKEIQIEYDPVTHTTQWIDPEWDPRFTIGIFGSRGTGKSFLARWLMSLIYWYYPEVYVFTETKMNSYWAQMVNPQFIYEGYNRAVLAKILENQEKKVEAWRDGKYKGNPLVLIVWDDCLPVELNYDKDDLFKQIYFNGRHFYVGNIMNAQYYFKIPKRYRANIDFTFSMKQEQENQLEAFYKEYSYRGKGSAEQYGSKILMNSFLENFAEATDNKGFILFSNRDKTKPSSERIYKGHAEDPGIFWVGSSLYWSKNPKHLEDIKSGKAREKAEKDLDEKQYEAWGLKPPSKGDANKQSKSAQSRGASSSSRTQPRPVPRR